MTVPPAGSVTTRWCPIAEGWAGTSVNTAIFRRHAVVSRAGHQFTVGQGDGETVEDRPASIAGILECRWHAPFTKNTEAMARIVRAPRIERAGSVVGDTGLEPVTFSMSTKRSNQLS
jgi:hypothetical protein